VSVFVTALKVLLVLDAIFLILVILLQAGRGEGIGAAFGASSMQSAFGTQTGTFFVKVTVGAAALFFGLVIVITRLGG